MSKFFCALATYIPNLTLTTPYNPLPYLYPYPLFLVYLLLLLSLSLSSPSLYPLFYFVVTTLLLPTSTSLLLLYIIYLPTSIPLHLHTPYFILYYTTLAYLSTLPSAYVEYRR